jgi:hypothetical protein
MAESKEGAQLRSFHERYPSLTNRSGAIRSGFPAKAEKLQYGELPQAGEEGLKGSTCHRVWLESARKSAKA